MLIAIPISKNKLDLHFGHCEEFALIKVDVKEKKIASRENIKAPPHEPGLLPTWLSQLGVDTVIAGGMGGRAKSLFGERNIKVLIGAPQDTPENIVAAYLNDTLSLGENCCDH